MKSDILLLTGWGSTCDVWESIIPALEDRYHINCITPPWVPENELAVSLHDLNEYIAALAASIKAATNVVAWSLGGLIAIRLALAVPERITKIVFIASAARFVDEETAINPEWFEKFQSDFKTRPEATLKKFIALQAKGDEFAQSALRRLRATLPLDRYDYNECGLGLSLLANLNLDKELKRLPGIAGFIHGECDSVLPVQAGRAAAAECGVKFYSIPAAGHAVHVSHPKLVSENILKLLQLERDE